MADTFDRQASIDAREDAIDNAEEGAGQSWMEHAAEVLRRVAEGQEELTTDDLRIAGLEECPGDPRALGAVMRNGSIMGWIERTDRTTNTTRVRAHRRPLRVWASLLNKP